MNHPKTEDVARFLDKMQITDSCWIWIGARSSAGYGHFYFYDKVVLAHRFSYELFVGPIEPGKLILHREGCGNPICINPFHLYMGTDADNAQDRVRWGNHISCCGEKNNSAKLSERDVLAIRSAHKSGEYISISAMADEFGVTRASISNVIRGVTWKHLEV